MDLNVLTAQKEVPQLSSVKATRKAGFIPINLYGYQQENEKHYVLLNEVEKIIKSGVKKFIFSAEGKEREVTIKEFQRHPLTWDLQHVDMMILDKDRKVKIKLPVSIIGEAYGVKNEGGMLYHTCRFVKVSALPSDIVDKIVVDVTKLKLEDSIYAYDLNIGNMELLIDKKTLICSVVRTRQSTKKG